ncbi:MAG: 2Fe-2S iron-sulfur cluster binding domain-containing protein [Gammaproteobacteria bacterium]|nr:2Fe-2S iron-sulfur cluster binding domain-containing protein [Gammaproteobacteria bacterium]
MTQYRFRLNDEAVRVDVEPRTHLADALREGLGFTGTHLGCEHGVCGACTVMIDGAPARACLAFTPACDGAEVRTIEGFEDDPVMSALREGFHAEHALQCGYCTPGFLISAYDIVTRHAELEESAIREQLSGNICRCSGYAGIVAAIKTVIDSGVAHGRGVKVSTATRPAPSDGLSVGPLQMSAAVASRSAAPTEAPMVARTVVDAAGGTVLTHRVDIAADTEAVWKVLHSPSSVVSCLPGATLRSPEGESPLEIAFTVALGPIRATFEGQGEVSYDERAKRGKVVGRGDDARTRTQVEGEVEFVLNEAAPQRCVLELSTRYAIAGPLGQFARGTIVAALAGDIVRAFAKNAESAALGREPGLAGTAEPNQGDAGEGPALGVGALLGGLLRRAGRQLLDRFRR